jgi:hypothetical protein
LLDSESANFDTTDSVFDLQSTPPGQTSKACPFDIEQSPVNLVNNLFDSSREEQNTGTGTPPIATDPIPPEQLRRMSIELVSNKMFREIGDRITG